MAIGVVLQKDVILPVGGDAGGLKGWVTCIVASYKIKTSAVFGDDERVRAVFPTTLQGKELFFLPVLTILGYWHPHHTFLGNHIEVVKGIEHTPLSAVEGKFGNIGLGKSFTHFGEVDEEGAGVVLIGHD
jgi:hypothetical protein